jgi:hypothetical protein
MREHPTDYIENLTQFGLGDSGTRGLESLYHWTELERTVQESTGIDRYISRKKRK